MNKHEELLTRLRRLSLDLTETGKTNDYSIGNLAADAIEAQAREIEATERQAEVLTDALAESRREIEGLRAQLAATAKNAFEAMPHDIPQRMKRKICVEAEWSMSLASRAYIEIRKAFTGEKYTANEDLDNANAALARLERENADLRRCLETEQWPVKHIAKRAHHD